MASIDDFLEPGERVVYRSRMGFVQTFWRILLVIVLIAMISLAVTAKGHSVWDGIAFGSAGMVPLSMSIWDMFGAEAVLTDSRLLFKKRLIDKVTPIPLAWIKVLRPGGVRLTVYGRSGAEFLLGYVPNPERLALAIKAATGADSPPILTGKLKAWSMIDYGIIAACLLLSIVVLPALMGVLAGLAWPLKLLAGLAILILAAAAAMIVAELLGAALMRPFLTAAEAETFFDARIPPRRLRRCPLPLLSHFRIARRFAGLLYGTRA